jgi:hypothetical protein
LGKLFILFIYEKSAKIYGIFTMKRLLSLQSDFDTVEVIMGLYGSLVSLDADGEHVHPLEEDGAPAQKQHWFAALSDRVIGALRRLTRH